MIKKLKSTSGQTLVEFALILLPLMFMMVIILDLGRAVYYYSAVYNAAREGARFGITNPENTLVNNAKICQAAQATAVGINLTCGLRYSNDNLANECLTGNSVCIGDDTSDPNHTYLYVKVRYQFQPVTPLIVNLLGTSSLPISSTAKMQIEGIPSN